MTRRPATWKIVTFGATLTGLGVAGAGLASADDDRRAPVPAGISVAAPAADGTAQSVTDSPDVAPAGAGPVDAWPQADSPTESAWDSPADASPDTVGPDTASAASADSPH